MSKGARRPIRILAADDHPMALLGIKRLLEDTPWISVVAEATTGTDAVAQAARHKPDVIVMDVGMPGTNGIEATRRIIAQQADAKILALSVHSHQSVVQAMFKAGAIGYLIKDCLSGELADAISAVAEGRTYLGKSICGTMRTNQSSDALLGPPPPLLVPLSDEDRITLRLTEKGMSSKEIGKELGRTARAVDKRRERLKKKLGVTSTVELAKWALEAGIATAE